MERIGIEITGDVSQLERALTKARQSAGDFSRQASRDLDGLVSSLAKTDKATREYGRSVEALGASFKRLSVADQALARAATGTKAAETAARQYAAALRGVEQSLERVDRAAASRRQESSGFVSGLAGGVNLPGGLGLGALGGAGAAGAIGGAVGALATGLVGDLGRDSVAAYREEAAALLFLASAAKEAGLGYQSALASASRFAGSVGINDRQGARLYAQALRATGQAGGTVGADDFLRALADQRAATGTQTALPDLVSMLFTSDEATDRLFGKNPSDIQEEYARSLGTTRDKLGPVGEKQAIVNELMREAAKHTGAASAALDTNIGRLDRLSTRLDNIKAKLGAIGVNSSVGGFAIGGAGGYLAALEAALSGQYVDPAQATVSGALGGLGATRHSAIAGFLTTGNVAGALASLVAPTSAALRPGTPLPAGWTWDPNEQFKPTPATLKQKELVSGLSADLDDARARRAYFARTGSDYPLQGIEDAYRARERAIKETFGDAPEAAAARRRNEELRAEQREEALERIREAGRRETARMRAALAGRTGSASADVLYQATEAIRGAAGAFGMGSQEFRDVAGLVARDAALGVADRTAGSVESVAALRRRRRDVLGLDDKSLPYFVGTTGRYGQRTGDLEAVDPSHRPLYRFEQQRGVYGQITGDLDVVYDEEVGRTRDLVTDALKTAGEVRARVAESLRGGETAEADIARIAGERADRSLLRALAGVDRRFLDETQQREYAAALGREEDRQRANDEEVREAARTLTKFVKDLQIEGTDAYNALRSLLKLDMVLDVKKPDNVSAGLFGNGTIRRGTAGGRR